jgi:hypothetical protein
MPLTDKSAPEEIIAQYASVPPEGKIDVLIMLGTSYSKDKANEKYVRETIMEINKKDPAFFTDISPELIAPAILVSPDEVQSSLYKTYRYLQVVLSKMYKVNELKLLLLRSDKQQHLSGELLSNLGITVTPALDQQHELADLKPLHQAAAGGDASAADDEEDPYARLISTIISQAATNKDMSGFLKRIHKEEFTRSPDKTIERLAYSFYEKKDKEEILGDLYLLGKAVHETHRALLSDPSLQAIMTGMIKAAGKNYSPETHLHFQKEVRQAINQGVRGKVERTISMFRAASVASDQTQKKAEWYDQVVNEIKGKEKGKLASGMEKKEFT